MADPTPIDIVVPVYCGYAETRRCLDSVLASRSATAFELVVVDDASPDTAITRLLDDLAAAGRLTLLRNGDNQGFVRSVNRGMMLHPERDVVLLNSDTEVANDWLDRLCAHAAAADVATVTPFSNNGTLCSYPFEDWPGGVPGTLGLAALDRLCAEVNHGRSAVLPTAVGFCMYIRRACLDQVGLFDADRFGRGYGEENDFCLRASQAGWRHLLAADVFIYHEGGVSFSAERFRLQEKALATLLAVYPDYLDRIGAFHGLDPAAPLRASIDIARLALRGEERRHVLAEQWGRRDAAVCARPVRLHILHGWGGGTARWVTDFCRTDTGSRNLVLRSGSDRNHTGRWLELLEFGVGETLLVRWELATPIEGTAVEHPQYQAVLEAVREIFGIGSMVVSSLIGHGLAALDTGLPTVVVLHDLYPFCPAVFAYFGTACIDCSDERLMRCMKQNPHNVFWHNTREDHWLALREAYGRQLGQPWIRIVAPSRSVRDRWVELLPKLRELPWTLIEHGLDRNALGRFPSPAGEVEGARRLRVVVPGRLHPHKGLLLVHEAAMALAEEIDFLLLGCGDFGAFFAGMPNVMVIPNYAHADLGGHLAGFRPDLALLPSVLPESFSYTLSEMFAFGLPVMATRLGAFAERIEDGVTGFLVDPNAGALLAGLRALAADRPRLTLVRQRVADRTVRDVVDMVRDYHGLLPEASNALRSAADHALTQAAAQRDQLSAETDYWRRRAHEAEAQRDAYARERDAMLNSRSWALTAPLRAAERLRRRLTCGSSHADGQSSAVRAFVAHPDPCWPRSELRRILDLPDAAALVMVASGIRPEDGEALSAVMTACVETCNRVIFVVPEDVAFRADQFRLLMMARRFFADIAGIDVAACRAGADVALVRADDPDSWSAGLAALGAGLPVMLWTPDGGAPLPLADDLPAFARFATPKAGAGILLAWLDAGVEECGRIAAATRDRLAGMSPQ